MHAYVRPRPLHTIYTKVVSPGLYVGPNLKLKDLCCRFYCLKQEINYLNTVGMCPWSVLQQFGPSIHFIIMSLVYTLQTSAQKLLGLLISTNYQSVTQKQTHSAPQLHKKTQQSMP